MRRWGFVCIRLLLLATLTWAASAHEVRPGYLELRQLDEDTYDVLWKIPALGDRRLALYVRVPDACTSTEPTTRLVGGAYIERWRSDCAGGLDGREIVIDGLAATRTDVLARVQRLDGGHQTARLTPDSVTFRVSGTPSAIQAVRTYTALGIEHILLGFDHLLFVLGLLWLVRSNWMLVKTVTAFTLGHSATLAAATFGWIGVPIAPVEAAIALSIVIVAVEAVKLRQGHVGIAARYPWMVALAFGLLHGLGFASALGELGIPPGEIPLALLFFNVGVEIGQIGFIAVVLGLLYGARRLHLRYPAWTETAAIYLVGALASFWCIERTTQFVLA